MPPSPESRLAKTAANRKAGLVGGFGLGCFVGAILVQWRWLALAPLSPDPAGGFIYPFANRGGVTHYFSAVQNYGFYGLLLFGFLIAAVASAMAPKLPAARRNGILTLIPRARPDDPDGDKWGPMALGGVVGGLVAIGLYFIGR